MSNAKHTKGPWAIGGAYGHHAVKVTSSNGAQVVAMVVDSEVSGISHGAPVYVPFIEGQANARLISAAPDHHAVALELDRLMLVIESAVRWQDQANHAAVLAMLKANRAAITKATGEQPK